MAYAKPKFKIIFNPFRNSYELKEKLCGLYFLVKKNFYSVKEAEEYLQKIIALKSPKEPVEYIYDNEGNRLI